MGCICSTGRAVEERDALSFSEYAAVDAGNGGFGVADKKMGKSYDDSAEFGVVVHGKGGASKAPEVSSLLGRAGIFGLDKAVEVLDTLGSSMSNLNPSSGFVSGVVCRGNKTSILAFEVANTIAKAANLMHSLSEENIQFLKKEILPSEGVQRLVSTDTNELLSIAAADKREEFQVFSVEVVRFGDLCKDPEWHNLARYFQKLDSDPTPRESLRDEAQTTMQQLITLAHHTSELYHELHALDRFEQDYRRKLQEEESLPTSRRGETLSILHSELKHQRKAVKNLKKKSLWSRTLEEVVEKLVEVVIFLHKEISEAFNFTGTNYVDRAPVQSSQRLGVSGLALHYANVINQIDNIVSRPIALPPNTRDTLYHGLPVGVKAALRSRLQSFSFKEEVKEELQLTVSQIKAEMQKTLHWISPMADNTIKAHQGFGWVGEWANMGTEVNKKPGLQNSVFRIQTLYHADKETTEEYILELVVWLHHLVEQVKNKGYGFSSCKPIQCPPRKAALSSSKIKRDPSLRCHGKVTIIQLSREDQDMLDCVSYRRPVLVRSKSQSSIDKKVKRGHRKLGLSRSTGSSPDKDFGKTLDIQFERTKVLDVIDGLDIHDPFSVDSLYP